LGGGDGDPAEQSKTRLPSRTLLGLSKQDIEDTMSILVNHMTE
jgi:hypothetical protein